MNFSNKSGGNNLKTENKMKKTSQTTLSGERKNKHYERVMHALSIYCDWRKNYYFRIITSLLTQVGCKFFNNFQCHTYRLNNWRFLSMLKRNLQRNQSVLVICSHSTINFMHLLNRIFPWSCFPGGIDLLLVNTSQDWLLIMLRKKGYSGSNIQLDKEKKTHLNALKALFCQKKKCNKQF